MSGSKRMHAWLRLTSVLLVGAISFALAPATAEAGFIAAFAGNTRITNSVPNIDGTVNWAVLDNTGSGTDKFATGVSGFDGFFVAGTGSGAFDTTASFLYLYQPVNNGVIDEGTSDFKSLVITVPGASAIVTSWGYFESSGTQYGFSDDAFEVKASNDFGTDGVAFSQNAPPNVGVTSPSIGALSPADAVLPSSVDRNPGSVEFDYLTTLGKATLTQGKRSLLVGFTAKLGPTFSPLSTFGNGGNGAAPTPTAPEPASIGLLALGSMIGAASFWRRRRVIA